MLSQSASTSTGSKCNLKTTYNANVPGAVKEQKRGIWELDPVPDL